MFFSHKKSAERPDSPESQQEKDDQQLELK